MKTGFKIVNDPEKKDQLLSILKRFIADERLHVEVGNYFPENEMNEIFGDVFGKTFGRVTHHCRHHNTVLSLRDRQNDIIREVEYAKSLNSSYSIIHLAVSNPGRSVFDQLEIMDRSLPLFAELNDIAREHDYAFYLENIYYNIPFYRGLFNQIRDEGLERIHFCMDLGHAKACSENTINEWYEFLRELQYHEQQIHFHLHMNYGRHDDHLSMIEYTPSQGDWFSGGIVYDRLIRELIMDFPDCRKIFEVKPGYALSNMDYIQRLLGETSETPMRSRVMCNDVFLSPTQRVTTWPA